MDCTMYQVLCSTISAFLIIMMDVSFLVIPSIVDRVSLKSLFRLRTLCRVSSWLQDTWEVAILWGCSTATVTPVWLFPPPSREKSSKGQWIWGDQPATMENIHPPSPRPPAPRLLPSDSFLILSLQDDVLWERLCLQPCTFSLEAGDPLRCVRICMGKNVWRCWKLETKKLQENIKINLKM